MHFHRVINNALCSGIRDMFGTKLKKQSQQKFDLSEKSVRLPTSFLRSGSRQYSSLPIYPWEVQETISFQKCLFSQCPIRETDARRWELRSEFQSRPFRQCGTACQGRQPSNGLRVPSCVFTFIYCLTNQGVNVVLPPIPSAHCVTTGASGDDCNIRSHSDCSSA